MDEDYALDSFLEEQYEDRFWFEPIDDAEQFELNQLALDREAEGEYDEEWRDELEAYYDSDDYDEPAFF